MGDIFGRDEVIPYQKDKQDEELEEKLTLEEEAFRLASHIMPMKANSFYDPPTIKVECITFSKPRIIELARIENHNLTEEFIIESAIRFCEDYLPVTFDSDDIVEVWFNAEGIRKFLKWCKTSKENTLFNL